MLLNKYDKLDEKYLQIKIRGGIDERFTVN